ncbi:MAG TPA: cupin domain-containing protein [Jatrophihabitantaceae bacterium]|jgi:quercetin dioxygenase-like cupin family protein
MTVRMTGPGAGETFPAGPVTFRVLDDGTGVGGRSGVVECTLAPGWPGPPQHVHREHDETFYVVSGTVRFTSGSEVLLAPAGSLVTAPIGDPHTFGNADPDVGARLLCTVTPERYLGYFRELQDLSAGPDGMLDPADVLALMSRYATEPYRPPVATGQ